MKRSPQIFGWLDQVKIDGHLPSSAFKVAYQLAQKTNDAEHGKSGALVTWQSIPTMAEACGLSDRMVRYAVQQLQIAGHVAIEIGRGPRRSNRYTLIQQYRQPIASLNCGNSGNPLPHLMGQSNVASEAIYGNNCGNPLPPNYSISNSITCARARASLP